MLLLELTNGDSSFIQLIKSVLWAARVFSSISRIPYTGISGRFLTQRAASDSIFMNIQNRTKCLLQPSRLFPSIWSHANHKYLGTYHLLCQDNKNPWKFRSMKCNRDVRQILRNRYIKLLFLECKIQNWQRLRINIRQKI